MLRVVFRHVAIRAVLGLALGSAGPSYAAAVAQGPTKAFEAVIAQGEEARRSDPASSLPANFWAAYDAVSLQSLGPETRYRAGVLLWTTGDRWLGGSHLRAALRNAMEGDDAALIGRVAEGVLDRLLIDSRFRDVAATAPAVIARLEALGASPPVLSKAHWHYGEALRETGERTAALAAFESAFQLSEGRGVDGWPVRVSSAIAIANLSAGGRASAKLLDLYVDLERSELPTEVRGALAAQLLEAAGHHYLRTAQIEQARLAFNRAAVLRARHPGFLDVGDAASALNAAAMVEVAGHDALSSPDLTVNPRIGTAYQYLQRAGHFPPANYRVRPFSKFLLDLSVLGSTANFLVEGAAPDLHQSPRAFRDLSDSLSLADDWDPSLRLRFLRAMAYHDLTKFDFGVLTAAVDEAAGDKRTPQADLLALANDTTLVALMVAKTDPQSTLDGRTLAMNLSEQGFAHALERRDPRALRSSATGLGGLSWLLYQLRGGRGDPLSMAFPYRLEALHLARQEAWIDQEALDIAAFEVLNVATEGSFDGAVASLLERQAAGHGALGVLVQQRQSLEQAQRYAERAILQNGPGPTKAVRLADLQTAQERLASRIARTDPDFGDVRREPLLTLAQTQAMLAEDEAVLMIYGGDDLPPEDLARLTSGVALPNGFPGQSVTIALVTRDSFNWKISNLSALELTTHARALRCQLDAASCGGATFEPGAFDGGRAFKLYNHLIAPLLPTLGDRRKLFVVAPGALSALPLDVLWTRDPDELDDPDDLGGAPWLVDQFTTVRLPAIGSLAIIAGTRRVDNSGGRFVGVGDPVINRMPADAPMLAPLTYSALEVTALASLFEADRRTVLLAGNATEDAVIRSELTDVEVLLFSTHGLPAGGWPGVREPGLVLSRSELPGSDDGFLTSAEVSGLQVNADWVILSACRTAASDGSPTGDSFSGLADSFLRAGARSVVVSNWDVRDDVAATFVIDSVERHRANRKAGRAEAMRAAALGLIHDRDDPSRAHPSVWATFSIIGDAF